MANLKSNFVRFVGLVGLVVSLLFFVFPAWFNNFFQTDFAGTDVVLFRVSALMAFLLSAFSLVGSGVLPKEGKKLVVAGVALVATAVFILALFDGESAAIAWAFPATSFVLFLLVQFAGIDFFG